MKFLKSKVLLLTLLLSSCNQLTFESVEQVSQYISVVEPLVSSPVSEDIPNSITLSTTESITNSQDESVKPSTASFTSVTSETSISYPINGNFTDQHLKEYYQSVDFSKTGQELLSQLQSLNRSKLTNKPGYKGLWDKYYLTDYDPENRSNYIAFYRGTSATKAQMNREHVWPNSRGGSVVEGDLHMTRPTLTSDNSSRGNSFYVEGMTSTTSGWDPYADGMEEIYRGIAARIVFYCVVAAPQLKLVDTNNTSDSNTMGKLSDLLKWNLQYDIDYTEINRNDGAESVQKNRNPFIDDRSLACRVWGNYNDETRSVCSNGVEQGPPTSISISSPSDSVFIGEDITLSYSLNPLNSLDGVTWSSSNPSVATVVDGVVRGVSIGTARISVTSTIDSSVSSYIDIEVKEKGDAALYTKEMNAFTATAGNIDNDPNISYDSEKGTGTSTPAIYDDILRIYQGGGIFKVIANNGAKIKSLTLGSAMKTIVSVEYDNDGKNTNYNIESNGTITLSDLDCTLAKFTCVGTDKNSRLYVNYLSVTYEK